jgi:hypothetical protein
MLAILLSYDVLGHVILISFLTQHTCSYRVTSMVGQADKSG